MSLLARKQWPSEWMRKGQNFATDFHIMKWARVNDTQQRMLVMSLL